MEYKTIHVKGLDKLLEEIDYMTGMGWTVHSMMNASSPIGGKIGGQLWGTGCSLSASISRDEHYIITFVLYSDDDLNIGRNIREIRDLLASAEARPKNR